MFAYKVQYAIEMEVLPCIYEKITKFSTIFTLWTIFFPHDLVTMFAPIEKKQGYPLITY